MGPKQKGRFEACPCARPSPVFLPCAPHPSHQFSSLCPPLGVANYDPGKNAQPRRGGRKTKLGRANGVTTGTRPTLQSRHPVPTGSYSHPAVKTTVQRSYLRGVRIQAVGPTRLVLKGWVRIRMPFWFWPILARSGVEACLPERETGTRARKQTNKTKTNKTPETRTGPARLH